MLAVLTSHPIQYQAPLWRRLARDARLRFQVWFLTPHAVKPSYDREFGKTFAWDRDLLGGYPNRFLEIADGWQMNRFRGVRILGRWQEKLRAHGVTKLWVEGWRFSEFWNAIRAAKKLGIEVWVRGETNDLRSRQPLKDVPRRLALKWLFSRVRRFLYIGSANRRFYQSFGISRERLISAPYCVDNEFFATQASVARVEREAIRKKWRVPEGSFCILFCGKFIAKKRPLDLVEALRFLGSDRFHGLFVGEGQLGDAMRSRLNLTYDHRQRLDDGKPEASHQGPTASFVGFLNQSEIPKAYIAADCLVLPSDSGETWGLVVNEAMASGLPCIVSDRCGCAEDLVGPVCAQAVFPMGHVDALAKALGHIRVHPPARELISRQIDAFAIERTAESVANLAANYSLG